ncbi:MAG: lysophospholipid acyltransferase family protein [Burkholderiales bacterium]
MSHSSNRVRQTFRIVLLFAHLFTGLALSALAYPVIGGRGRAACFRWWSKRLLRIAGVRVVVRGSPDGIPPHEPVLVLSNHVSWLDIFVIRASLECRFVAKSEIRHWPLVGWLVARQGTVFVVRARRHDTSRVNASLESALKRGERMVVFPEGTTTDGSEVKPFHGSLLQPVVATQGYAMPVAIRYLDTEGRRSDRAAYAGDRSLWDSTRLITGESMTVAEIRFLAAVHAVGRHRRDLAQHCAKAVADALELPHP